MKPKQICMARVLKNISYILAPIFFVLLILCALSIEFITTENSNIANANNYFETRSFSSQYFSSIYNKYVLIDEDEFGGGYTDKQTASINGTDGTIYYNAYMEGNFKYLIVNKKSKMATTNMEHTMKTDTIEEIIQSLQADKLYWNYKAGEVETTIDNLNLENIRYNSSFLDIYNNKDMEIYTILLDDMPYSDSYYSDQLYYNAMIKTYKISPLIIPISFIGLIACVVAIVNGIGKTRKDDKIHLNWFDKMKLGFVLAMGLAIFIIGIIVFIISADISIVSFTIMGIAFSMLIIYVDLILIFETIVKRIKTNTLIKSTICYSIFKGIKSIIDHRTLATKLILFYGAFCILGFFFTSRMLQTRYVFVYGMFLLSLGFLSLWYLFCRLREFDKIRDALKSIYEGNTKINLNPNEQKGVLKELSIYIQDIAGGLSNAVNESLKSERLKTELITNVSHDIKTPLTSIINYVDLLKKEKMPNEKCTEYLMILDNKSQRLKRLTEDLVEASKASSGNIKLKMEQIDIVELLKQVSGEFEDRFKARGLEEVMTLPEEPITINADGRYLYRVLENIYSNVAKYAMENTRVYLDVIAQKKSVVVQMKNISQERLNISADELMQRFVRGEASRNTEGSGLGLSIASSLTELQGGKFHIYLDGDLFKVTIGFNRI